MAVISSEPVEELAMKGCCCFHEDSSLTVINVSSVQGCSANWDRHQTEECSPDSVLGIEWKIQFHSCRLSMRSVVGDRVTTLLECDWLTKYGLGFLLSCVNSVLAKQKDMLVYLNPEIRRCSQHWKRKNILPQQKKGSKCTWRASKIRNQTQKYKSGYKKKESPEGLPNKNNWSHDVKHIPGSQQLLSTGNMDQKMAMHNNMPILEDKEETELYGIWQKKSLSEVPNLIYKIGTAQAVVDSCAAVLISHLERSLGWEESTQPSFANSGISKRSPWWISIGTILKKVLNAKGGWEEDII